MSDHPFYPRDLVLEGYVPVTWSIQAIFAAFGAVVAAVVAVVWLLSGRCKVTAVERWIMCWWAVTGLIHLLLEGYFSLNPRFYQYMSKDFFTDVWKEYSMGDSRYAARDAFVVSMESVTAFVEGPGSLVALYAIATKASYREPLQLAVSLGQLYGDVLYFATCFLEGFVHAAPGAQYFWLYFVFMNSIWVVIPGLIFVRSWRRMCLHTRAADDHLKAA